MSTHLLFALREVSSDTLRTRGLSGHRDLHAAMLEIITSELNYRMP